MELVAIIFITHFIVYSLCMYSIRIGMLTAWKAAAMMAVLSILGGYVYYRLSGFGILGAMCLWPMLFIPLAGSALVWGKNIEKNAQHRHHSIAK
ncbi:MAG: hypothetical protein JXB15_17235 [Anaerolineales bacterium]|nr:hypothetical protein [Anaerolineales bacterium]